MSFTIYYTSARSVTDEEAENIKVVARKYCDGRSWLSCEPVSFFNDLQDGLLIGGSKPNLKPDAEDKRAAQESGLPDGSIKDLLDILARISGEKSVDWDLMHDFGPVGSIRGGSIDSATLSQIEALADLRL